MLIAKEVGQRALGRCYSKPQGTRAVELFDTLYYEIELDVRMPRGEKRKIRFYLRVEKNEIYVRNAADGEYHVELHTVSNNSKIEDWMVNKEFDFWTMSAYYRAHSSSKVYCKKGILYLPIYLDKEDFNKAAYLRVYPSIIDGVEKVVIESFQLSVNEEK